jgi:thiol-disulfide isomerase/thioredoxin
MKRLLTKDRVLLGLALLAFAQATILTVRMGRTEGPANTWFQVGDTLSGIRVLDSAGNAALLSGGEPTVVLVFNSSCGHCEAVAPLWRAWTTAFGDDFRTVAISSEPLESARAYVNLHGWTADVWTVEAGTLGSPEHGLTARTPWIFILDKNGVVLAERHGQEIAEVGALFGADVEEISGA